MNDENKLAGDAPAFPVKGMSLRDYFAGMALQGLSTSYETLLSNHDLVKEFGVNGINDLQASKAYRLADAMIAERNKRR